jgi:hypothetical protein
MKKEFALIIGSVADILLIYPLTRFTNIGSNWVMILMVPLLFIILYSIYHSVTLLFNRQRKKAIIFVSLLVVAIIVSFQFVLLMIRLTIPIVA